MFTKTEFLSQAMMKCLQKLHFSKSIYDKMSTKTTFLSQAMIKCLLKQHFKSS